MLGIVRSLLTTVETGLRRPVTIQSPQVHKKVPDRGRGLPLLLWDYDVEEPFCVGCHQCERACPVECITVTLQQNPKFESGGSKRKTIVDEFFIDEARCMRCNICAEVCPTNFAAITLRGSGWLTSEMSVFDRQDLVLDVHQLLAPSKEGDLINPLTPEQNQLAPEGSRARRWARGEVEGASEVMAGFSRKRPGRARTWAKAKLLKIVYRIRRR
jgi:formate hydrogenlyase subunit 6/NADH:ubiquinone oxidoreductase subunit I